MASRILGKGALAGGVPFYKYAANRWLTFAQNVLCGQKLSEYHTGYRAFSRAVLEKLPLYRNSDDFIFDNEILAQAIVGGYRIGEVICRIEKLGNAISVETHSTGYDGQFYYRLALDPFTANVTDFGIRLDNPPYRQQRIVYPLLTWLLAFGDPEHVPWVMIGINFAALCLIGAVGGRYSQSLNRHAFWGLALSLYPGFLFSLTRNLTEIIEICLLLCGLWLWKRHRWWWAAVLLTAAILTKETALLAVAVFFAAGIWRTMMNRENPNHSAWPILALPMLCYLIWQGVLAWHWGVAPIFASSGQLGMPMAGIVMFLRDTLSSEIDPLLGILHLSVYTF